MSPLMIRKNVLLSMFLATVAPNFAVAQGYECSSIFTLVLKAPSQVETISHEHQQTFDQLFLETSGFDSYASYEKMIRLHSEPEIAKALEVLDKQQLEVVIRAPEHVREAIGSTGFKNTHETKTNAGQDSDASQSRKSLESNVFGFDLLSYSQISPSVKPKYGSVRPKPESGLTAYSEPLAPYGTDSYHLKTEAISSRLSFTIDDMGSVAPFPQAATKREWFESIKKGRSWYHSAIPWNRRLLMVPFLARGIQYNNLFLATSFNNAYKTDLQGPKTEIASSYFEAQIFGNVDLSAVAAFEFANTPPTGLFLKALTDRKIKILDGRQQPPIEWYP